MSAPLRRDDPARAPAWMAFTGKTKADRRSLKEGASRVGPRAAREAAAVEPGKGWMSREAAEPGAPRARKSS